MIHIHLNNCSSTQIYLQTLIETGEYDIAQDLLVSCERQSEGQGQRSKIWMQCDQALAASFITWPSDRLSLSSLEMAIHTQQFIEKQFQVKTYFKWPNDIYLLEAGKYKKCAGILIQSHSRRLIVGIGINIHHANDFPYGTLCKKTIDNLNQKSLALNFYKHIQSNRLSSHDIGRIWTNSCFHLNKKVSVTQEAEMLTGIFKGVGEHGQCLLETKSGLKEFFSAGLILDQ